MATVVDAARPLAAQKNAHNTTYQTGNAESATPNATWVKTADINASVAETAIALAYQAATNNTANAQPPAIEGVYLATTPATTRF